MASRWKSRASRKWSRSRSSKARQRALNPDKKRQLISVSAQILRSMRGAVARCERRRDGFRARRIEARRIARARIRLMRVLELNTNLYRRDASISQIQLGTRAVSRSGIRELRRCVSTGDLLARRLNELRERRIMQEGLEAVSPEIAAPKPKRPIKKRCIRGHIRRRHLRKCQIGGRRDLPAGCESISRGQVCGRACVGVALLRG